MGYYLKETDSSSLNVYIVYISDLKSVESESQPILNIYKD